MLLIAGTIPEKDLPVTYGEVKLQGNFLIANGRSFYCTQGTGAMITAALMVTEHFKIEPPRVLVSGDIGEGQGTRNLFRYLIEQVNALNPEVLALHYCLPIMSLMKSLTQSMNKARIHPFMIADAGAMYAAKAAGLATTFDIFTPDPSEIAFLADPDATHPAYISRHLFQSDADKVTELITNSYKYKNAARLLIVKGKTDYIAADGRVLAAINEPNVPSLEPIGGTGDTITGLATGLVAAGLNPTEAAIIAAKTNRMAGYYAQPTPATMICDIIKHFPAVLNQHLAEWRAEQNHIP